MGKRNFKSRFMEGTWLMRAKEMLNDSVGMKTLLQQAMFYLSKQGLGDIKEKILLLCHYVQDVITHKYTNYDRKKLLLIVAALIYLVALVDFIPDWLPLGLIDDSAIIMWVIGQVGDELKRYDTAKKDE